MKYGSKVNLRNKNCPDFPELNRKLEIAQIAKSCSKYNEGFPNWVAEQLVKGFTSNYEITLRMRMRNT